MLFVSKLSYRPIFLKIASVSWQAKPSEHDQRMQASIEMLCMRLFPPEAANLFPVASNEGGATCAQPCPPGKRAESTVNAALPTSTSSNETGSIFAFRRPISIVSSTRRGRDGSVGKGLTFFKSGKWAAQPGDGASVNTGHLDVSSNDGQDESDPTTGPEEDSRSRAKLKPGFFNSNSKSADSNRSFEWHLRHDVLGVKSLQMGEDEDGQALNKSAHSGLTSSRSRDDNAGSHEKGETPGPGLCVLMKAIMEDVVQPVKAEVVHLPYPLIHFFLLLLAMKLSDYFLSFRVLLAVHAGGDACPLLNSSHTSNCIFTAAGFSPQALGSNGSQQWHERTRRKHCSRRADYKRPHCS